MRRKRGRKPLILLTSVATIGFGISLLSWFETEVQAQDATLVVNVEKEEVKPLEETSFTGDVTQDNGEKEREKNTLTDSEDIVTNQVNKEESHTNSSTEGGTKVKITNSDNKKETSDTTNVENQQQKTNPVSKSIPSNSNTVFSPFGGYNGGVSSSGGREIRPGDDIYISGSYDLWGAGYYTDFFVISPVLFPSTISYPNASNLNQVDEGAKNFAMLFEVEESKFYATNGNTNLIFPLHYELYGAGQFDAVRSSSPRGRLPEFSHLALTPLTFEIRARAKEEILEFSGSVKIGSFIHAPFDNAGRLWQLRGRYPSNSFSIKDRPLIFSSAPSSLDFGDELEISTEDKIYPIFNSENTLIVTDERNKTKDPSWRMKATLQQELTSTTNVEHKLPDALHYKKQGQDLPLVLNESQIIYEKKTDSDAPVVISDEWSGIENGPVLEVKAGKAYAESYGGSVRWTLEDVPSNQG